MLDARATTPKPHAEHESPLPAIVLSDGKIGDEVQCFGILNALAEHIPLVLERRIIAPRTIFAALAPFGPMDPREAPHRPMSPIRPPYPAIAISAGRRTVPYLRALKRASASRTFTIFVKDPYTGTKSADMLWVPEHDRLRGDNVVVTLTPPHSFTPRRFAAMRAHPDPRFVDLPHPRLAIIMGGSSVNYDFTPADSARLAAIAGDAALHHFGVMVTASRRTPDHAKAAMRTALRERLADGTALFWDGHNAAGENPYLAMLALADFILVTADSVNMVGEATASGAPVYLFEPSGKGHAKMDRYIASLALLGAVRPYAGRFEPFSYEPHNSAPTIAAAILPRFLEHVAIKWIPVNR